MMKRKDKKAFLSSPASAVERSCASLPDSARALSQTGFRRRKSRLESWLSSVGGDPWAESVPTRQQAVSWPVNTSHTETQKLKPLN